MSGNLYSLRRYFYNLLHWRTTKLWILGHINTNNLQKMQQKVIFSCALRLKMLMHEKFDVRFPHEFLMSLLARPLPARHQKCKGFILKQNLQAFN